METFRELPLEELQGNVFQRIGKDWMLVATQNGEGVNMLTASWGGLGILWGKPVAFVFLRPQRFTRELVDAAATFSLTFFDESWRDQLQLCGTKSGRDLDKVEACGFQVARDGSTPYFAQAHTALLCRKLYRSQLEAGSFLDPALCQAMYPQKDFHYVYVAEITKALVK